MPNEKSPCLSSLQTFVIACHLYIVASVRYDTSGYAWVYEGANNILIILNTLIKEN